VIVLDTHAWIWWVGDPERLSAKAKYCIDKEVSASQVYVSSISVWEISALVNQGRLSLKMDVEIWVEKSEALPFLKFIPVDNALAMRSVLLPEPLHPDPADRIIVATALRLGAHLITKDDKLHKYPHVPTIW